MPAARSLLTHLAVFSAGIVAGVVVMRMRVRALRVVPRVAATQFHTVLLSLDLPDNPESIARNRAMIDAVMPQVSHVLYLAFEGVTEHTKVSAEVINAALAHYDDCFETLAHAGRVDVDCRVLMPAPGLGMANEQFVYLLPDLQAVCGRFSPEMEATVAQVNHFRNSKQLGKVAFVSLSDAADKATAQGVLQLDDMQGRLPRFGRVCCGGTFDHLHIGHKKLLTLACLVCKNKLTIGVTCDEMLATKSIHGLLEPLDVRCRRVQEFVACMNPSLYVDIVPIEDPYGPSIIDPELDAIIVSSETLKGAFSVNQKRKERRLKELTVVSKYRSSLISSTFIRQSIGLANV